MSEQSQGFLKRNWLGLLGISIGILGICLSVYFYSKSVQRRVPCFLVDPVRTKIIDSSRISNAPLKVLRADDSKVLGDISSLRMYFWNAGRMSIHKSDILQPLTIDLADSTAKILDYRIVKISRDVVNPSLIPLTTNSERSLVLSFDIMEANDGVVLQVIFEGAPDCPVTIGGVIESVPAIITEADMRHSQFWRVYSKELGTLVLFIIIGLVGSILWLFLELKFEKRAKKLFSVLPLIFLLGVIIWYIGINPILESRKKAVQNLTQSLPSTIVLP